MSGRITIVLEDITFQRVGAIVNAANPSLLGGGGVDGAIHRAAGPELLEACRKLGGCPTGEARITPGFRLPALWIIHTVGPVWSGGEIMEDALLASCYRNTLLLAAQRGLRTLAFPQISTGAYGFPRRRAAAIAIAEILAGLQRGNDLHEVRCVCFDGESQAFLREALAHATPG
jgi:O-acetyl-ADP-ribose deacetylase (regulator of RNase III)